MKGSLKIAQFAGIPVKVHWTFGLLILWIGYIAATNGLGLTGILLSVLIMLIIFACVVMHEYGHALTARKFDVRTRDIILSPIGGIARLESLPEVPRHEFLIAIAGPLVNVGIIILLGTLQIILTGSFPNILSAQFWSFAEEQSVVLILLKINMILVGFNMVPAFPMDGGRVVRALLTSRVGRRKATRIASLIGQALAGIFFITGLITGDIILSIIGVFVFFAASSEYRAAVMNETLKNIKVRDIVRHQYTRLYTFGTMASAMRAIIHGSEDSFLVFSPEDQPVAVLHKTQIIEAVRKGNIDELIASHMSTHYEFIDAGASVKDVLQLFQKKHYVILPVLRDGRLVGVIDQRALNTAFEMREKSISRKPLFRATPNMDSTG